MTEDGSHAMIHHRKKTSVEGLNIKRTFQYLLAASAIAVLASPCLGQVRVVVDHVGYESTAGKTAFAVVSGEDKPQDVPKSFTLIDDATGKTVLSGAWVQAGEVDRWNDRKFWTADFTSWKKPGAYRLVAQLQSGMISSCAFTIDENVLERSTLSNVIFYFKGQRATGDLDRADRHLQLTDGGGVVDLSGGWYDATGDYGIHLSHQNPTSYFNPQQVPLVVWSLLRGYQELEARHDDDFTEYEHRMLDEGMFGADFLARLKRPGGSFLQTISAPGKQKLAVDRAIGNPNTRTQIKKNAADSTEKTGAVEGAYAYQASFRAGAGMTIAALALASTMPADGDIPHAEYLKDAKEAFAFLQQHNSELVNDGKENILDDYCALMAATALFRATQDETYRQAAKARADHLMARLVANGKYAGSWRADDGSRPFFHPSDAGLPVVSLLEYATIATGSEKARALEAVSRSLHFELSVTSEVNNPFGYGRQVVRMGDGSVRTAFFFPHDTEAAPWWQGENARLASLASAARLAAPYFKEDKAFHAQLEKYAWDQLHWILGRNPFDASMLMGSGHGNAPYMFFRSYKYTNAPGAIINGITAGRKDEDGIAFNEGYAVTGADEDWRWTEEWLPHAAWYLFAATLPHD